jgi:hypothetical protein
MAPNPRHLLSLVVVVGLVGCALTEDGVSKNAGDSADGVGTDAGHPSKEDGGHPTLSADAGSRDAAPDVAVDEGGAQDSGSSDTSIALHFVIDNSDEAALRNEGQPRATDLLAHAAAAFIESAGDSTVAYTTYPDRTVNKVTSCEFTWASASIPNQGDCPPGNLCLNTCTRMCPVAACDSLPDPSVCCSDLNCGSGLCDRTLHGCSQDSDCGAGSHCYLELPAFCLPTPACLPTGTQWRGPDVSFAATFGASGLGPAIQALLPGGTGDQMYLAYPAAVADAVAHAAAHPHQHVGVVLIRAATPLPPSSCDKTDHLVSKAQAALKGGVRTFVVEISPTTATGLDDLGHAVAVAGGTGDSHVVTCAGETCSALDTTLVAIGDELKR